MRNQRWAELEGGFREGEVPLNVVDENGNTLLMQAVQNGYKRGMKICLRAGVEANLQNYKGNTALHYAHEYGYEELAEYLKTKVLADDTILNEMGENCYDCGLKNAAFSG
jgi:ankyrin repeat protein